MTRQELIDKIEGSIDRKWQPEEDIVFTVEGKDKTIWAKGFGFAVFQMEHGGDNMGDFHLSSCKEIKDFNDLILFIKKVSAHVGYDLKIDGYTSTPVEQVVVDKTDKIKESLLAGKVEAYENILIGRDITASE